MSKDEKEKAAVNLTDDQLEKMLDRVAHSATAAGAEGMRQAIKPDNAVHPGISAFNPLGDLAHPRPKLVRETFFCGVRQREEQMTTAEIEAFNAITSDRTARNGRWWAKVEQNGSRQRLTIFVPNKSIDERMDMPNGLVLILRELAQGAEAVTTESMAAKLIKLEAELEALKASDRAGLAV